MELPAAVLSSPIGFFKNFQASPLLQKDGEGRPLDKSLLQILSKCMKSKSFYKTKCKDIYAIIILQVFHILSGGGNDNSKDC